MGVGLDGTVRICGIVWKKVRNIDMAVLSNYYSYVVNNNENELTVFWNERRLAMKVENIKDINKFFSVVDECKGKVELVTGEGDRLNLKSKLSQYVSLANIFSDGVIKELELVAYEPEDIDRLFKFMINQ